MPASPRAPAGSACASIAAIKTPRLLLMRVTGMLQYIGNTALKRVIPLLSSAHECSVGTASCRVPWSLPANPLCCRARRASSAAPSGSASPPSAAPLLPLLQILPNTTTSTTLFSLHLGLFRRTWRASWNLWYRSPLGGHGSPPGRGVPRCKNPDGPALLRAAWGGNSFDIH